MVVCDRLVFEAGNSINLTDVDVSAMFNTIDDCKRLS